MRRDRSQIGGASLVGFSGQKRAVGVNDVGVAFGAKTEIAGDLFLLALDLFALKLKNFLTVYRRFGRPFFICAVALPAQAAYTSRMEELHFIGGSPIDRTKAEAVHPDFIRDGLLKAREKTWDVYHQIKQEIKEGMTEAEGRDLALSIFAARGVERHWHRPWLRFGPGTALTFKDIAQKEYRLKANDAVYMDLGPVWREDGMEYEGDVGDTFVFGENREITKLTDVVHAIWEESKALYQTEKVTGLELYALIKRRAEEAGYLFLADITGHRVSDYPHVKYSKDRLDKIPFNPASSLWILEYQLNHPSGQFGAFFEDLLI